MVQYQNMVSTTVEKALFIVVGLGIFAMVGVPLFNVISSAQHSFVDVYLELVF
ncbi:MAG: hypothetical protein ACFFCS_16840 [Candidatus Hodarchaeota archaeon]